MIPYSFRLLSLVLFLPLLGALATALLPARAAKACAATIAAITFGLTVFMATAFQASTFHYQFGESFAWIPQFGISYLVGVDGLSLWLVVLTAFLGLCAILVSRPTGDRPRGFFALVLALMTTMLGVFVALDLVLFYTFFELSLVPVALLIFQYGNAERRRAATAFFASLFAGSILMLVAMVVLAGLHNTATGRPSFSLLDLQHLAAQGDLWRGSPALQPWIFWAFALAFLVKSPAIPVHGWLPVTYEGSPVAPLVASVVLKVGTYGLFRFCLPLFPEAVQTQAPILGIIGVAGILYGAVIAATQRGTRRLLAFSTVSHVGFILIGLLSLSHAGLLGASFMQTNHGLVAGALLVLMAILQRRRNSQDMDDFGALKRTMPLFAALFFVVLVGNMGLPGTSGFVGEFLTMLGAFESGVAGLAGYPLAIAILAGLGTVLAAVYSLGMFGRMFTGPKDRARRLAAPARPEPLRARSSGARWRDSSFSPGSRRASSPRGWSRARRPRA